MGKKKEESFMDSENGKNIYCNEYCDYARLDKELKNNLARVKELEGYVERLEDDNAVLTKNLENKEMELKYLSRYPNYSYWDARRNVLEDDNANLAKKLARSEKQLAYFKDNNVTVKMFKKLEKVKGKLENKIEDLEKEKKLLSMKLETTTTGEREKEMHREIDFLKEENSTLQEDKLILQDLLDYSENEVDSLRGEVNQLRESYSNLYRIKEKHTKEYKNILEWLELLPQEIQKLDDFFKSNGLTYVLEQKSYKDINELTGLLKHDAEKLREEKAELVEEKHMLGKLRCTPKRLEKLIRSKKILVMGGHINWQNRIKEVYPSFTYMDSDNVNFDVSILKTADYIFFNTLHCSHTLYFKVKDNVSTGRDKQYGKAKLVYINNNNVDVFTEIFMEKMLETERQ